MGEGQWWEPTVKNDLDVAIRIADFELQYGKCYDIADPYNETSCPNGTVIQPGQSFTFGTCGRASSPTGTEGTFNLVIDGSSERIAEIYFNCPWGGGTNQANTNGQVNPSFAVAINGFNQSSSGPLGKGQIIVIKN